jgi:hypothetical protein
MAFSDGASVLVGAYRTSGSVLQQIDARLGDLGGGGSPFFATNAQRDLRIFHVCIRLHHLPHLIGKVVGQSHSDRTEHAS